MPTRTLSPGMTTFALSTKANRSLARWSKLLSQQFYVDGIPNGPDREWWSDGTLKSEGQVRYGLPHGVFHEWHKNGQLAREKFFGDTGQLQTVLEWDEAGNPINCRNSIEAQ